MSVTQTYRGRFAPTPSGPLHLGSLLTALASHLQARTAGGTWLLRLDDLDSGRSTPEHAATILRQLEAHALQWDEPPRLQSQHVDEYRDAFVRLQQLGLLFPCGCTRARLARDSLPGVDGPVYAGTCRGEIVPGPHCAWRLRVGTGQLRLSDPWQGELRRDLERDIGDFVVRRADGIIGYQLACTVDEVAQGITEVVRGADLIGSSFRQLYLQQVLGLAHPAYRHLPVLAAPDGLKLSKQNHATPIAAEHAGCNLYRCLELLGQAPPAALRGAGAAETLRWGLQHWDPGRAPRRLQMTIEIT
ncbi:MAG: tRNA glutamyl-Q(34) synthetase GluQRS [Nevskia sp.]|nr:tRNA glutamyl-Q(34) synthetase GluQRS [Nevskia sp.]